MAERIRANTEADRFAPNDTSGELNVTLSIGFAVFPGDGEGPDALIEAADQALYRSKQSGRNRVTAAKSPRATS